MQVTSTEVKTRTFYSKSAGLCIAVNHGKLTRVNGEDVRVGEKLAEFSPAGGNAKTERNGTPANGAFGHFHTDDPEIIAFMENRIKTVGDVFGPEEYNRLITPPEQREAELRDEIRRLSDQNRLLGEIAKEKGK